MPIFIVIKGVSRSGKTTSIKKLYEDLSGNALPQKPKDFKKTLKYKGLTVGFSSEGDRAIHIKHKVEELIKIGCDVIISACRSYGATTDIFLNYKVNYTVYFIEKTPERDSAKENAANSATALEIKNILDSLAP